MSDPKPEITVYATRWCGDCMMAKHVLKKQGVPFRLIDIDDDPTAADVVQRINGGMKTVPTILFPDGSVLVEPGRRQLEAALDHYRQTPPAA